MVFGACVDFSKAVEYTVFMAKNGKKNQTGIALACWILGLLILIIVFFVKQEEIVNNLKTTQFFERIFGVTPEFIKNFDETSLEKKNSDSKSDDGIIQLFVSPENNGSVESGKNAGSEKPVSNSAAKTENKPEITEPEKESPVENKETNKKTNNETKSSEVASKPVVEQKENPVQEKKPEPVPPASKVTRRIYFVFIGEDGVLSRKMVTREVEKNNSPLVTSINLLLDGPQGTEVSKGCKSLIPNGTKLKSASVRDGVAYLNFNEDFEFNPLGVDGYLGQLMQVVFTATEFSTVNCVQFLIEGEKKEYLGSEGVWIGSPLSRGSF